jgi:hypothetical protein
MKSTDAMPSSFGLSLLLRIGALIRLSSLSLLFAGSAAIVFAAITLVKAGEAHGLTVSQAAAANAPIFIQYGKVVAAVGVLLLIAEAIDSFCTRRLSKLKLSQYIASALCCLCAFIFAFVCAPMMDHLLPYISTDTQAHENFHRLHESSRLLFSGMILCAWTSLILPIFGEFGASSADIELLRKTS